MPKVVSYPASQNSLLRKNFTVPFLKYERLKPKLRVFLAGHRVAMVTCSVTKIIPTCSPMIGQFFDTMIVASTNLADFSQRWQGKMNHGSSMCVYAPSEWKGEFSGSETSLISRCK